MAEQEKALQDKASAKFYSQVLFSGLGLGVLADILFAEVGPIGPGFIIWLTLFSIAALWLLYQIESRWFGVVASWSLVALGAAFMLLFSTTPILIFLMLLIILVAAAMVFLQTGGVALRESTVADYLVSQISVAFHAIAGIRPVLAGVDVRASISHPRLWAIGRGILLVTPLLVIFVALFASADAVFSAYASQLMTIFSPALPRHVLVSLLFAWVTTGLLASVCFNSKAVFDKEKFSFQLGTEETAVIMGALVSLFIGFVILQLGYLFGGRETIEITSGLTLAEYARRGFFELLVVSGLTFTVLIVMSGVSANQRIFRSLATILIACVLIILLSAGQRLLLYIESFGLTLDRFIAIAFVFWLGIGLLLFAATILRGKSRDFLVSLLGLGISAAFILTLINPAAQVAEFNLDRAIDRVQIVDIHYLLSLDADAVSVIVEKVSELDEQAGRRCYMAGQMLNYWFPTNGFANIYHAEDWRSWNASRSKADKLVLENQDSLVAMAENCAW